MLASGWRLQYRTLRCAADCSDRVFVLGTEEARPLERSRWCSEFAMVLTGFSDDSVVATVSDRAARWQVSCILPSDGETTRFLARHRHALGAASYPVPDLATFDALDCKHTFMHLCRRVGVPVPRSWLVASRHELARLLSSQKPGALFVAKPLERWGGKAMRVVRSDLPVEAVEAIDCEPMLVQEFVEGEDICAFLCCKRGKVVAEVIYGEGEHRIDFIRHEGIARDCRAIVEALSFDGVVGFDLREGPDGHRFLDCNPRFWRDMDIAMLAGINFVAVGLGATSVDVRQIAGVSVFKATSVLRMRLPGLTSRRSKFFHACYLADMPMLVALGWNKLMGKRPGRLPGQVK